MIHDPLTLVPKSRSSCAPADPFPATDARLRRVRDGHGVGISFAVYLPDLYEASALVLVERQVSEPSSGLRRAASSRALQIIKQEILSRSRLTDLVERFNLYPACVSAAGWRRSSIRAGGTFRST